MTSPDLSSSLVCDFCDVRIIQRQGIYKADLATILYPKVPFAFGHMIVIPNQHRATFIELTDEEILAMSNLVKTVFTSLRDRSHAVAFNMFTNNGTKAGQSVPHVHWHVFIRFNEEIVSPFEVMANRELAEKLTFEEWEARRQRIISLLNL